MEFKSRLDTKTAKPSISPRALWRKAAPVVTHVRPLMVAWEKNGVRVAGRIWEAGSITYLGVVLFYQMPTMGVAASLRPILAAALFIISSHLTATDQNNARYQTSCGAGIVGTFLTLWPRIFNREPDAIFAFSINAAINTYGIFNKKIESSFKKTQKAICTRPLLDIGKRTISRAFSANGRPNFLYGFMLELCYAHAIHNGLAHISRPDGIIQVGLYTVFAAAAAVFSGSKPNSLEPSLASRELISSPLPKHPAEPK